MLVMNPFAERPLRGTPLAVFDFETTGPNPKECEPVQVAVVHCDLGESEPDVVLNQLINPGVAIPDGARAVHGISDDMVADQPSFQEVLPQLLTALEGRAVVAFNLPFDWQILARGVAAAGHTRADLPFGALDPLVWAKVLQRYEKGKKLVDVAARFGVDVDAHDAAGDAIATAKIMPLLLRGLGRHASCGKSPLLSLGAMWTWTLHHGLLEDEGFARWRAKKGQSPPGSSWREILSGWWPSLQP